MNITVTFADTEIVLAVEVAPDMSVADFRAYVLEEAGFKSNPDATLFHNNRQLDASQTLQQASLYDNDMIIVNTESSADAARARGAPSGASASAGSGANAGASGVINEDALNAQIEAARQQILYEPQLFTQLSRQSPDLAQALHDAQAFRKAYRKLYDQQLQLKAENEEIDRNFHMAMEEMPEAFATVTMLFANIEVNGVPVKAFIDSGAQTTIMSPDCAERCHLSHLVDKRHRGMAYGVGQAKILGRIHMAPIKIGSSYFACAMTVIEGTNMEFLLGLDMLKHHQAVIDLKSHKLRMGDEELPFLNDNEIPQNFGSPGAAVPAASVSANTRGPGSTEQNADSSASDSSAPGASASGSSASGSSATGAAAPGAAALGSSTTGASAPGATSSLGAGGSPGFVGSAAPPQSVGPMRTTMTPLRSSAFMPGIQLPAAQLPAGQQAAQPVQLIQPTQRARPTQPSSAPSSQFSPTVVANLTSLGFSQSQVLEALRRAGGNPDIAAALLFEE